MTTMEKQAAEKALPAQFADLQFLVPMWALPTENERSRKRWSSSKAEFQELYDAMIDRIEDVIAYLDGFAVGAMPEDAHTLYHLALAFAEAAPHVEMYKGSSVVPNSFDADRVPAAHGDIVD